MYVYRAFKNTLLKNAFLRAMIKRAILFSRPLARSRRAFVLLWGFFESGSLRRRALRSDLFVRLAGRLDHRLWGVAGFIEKIARYSGPFECAWLRRLGVMYQYQRRFDKAFDIFFFLFRRTSDCGDCQRALTCERELGGESLYNFFLARREQIEPEARCLLECEYSIYREGIVPDWQELWEVVTNNPYNVALLSSAIYAAVGFLRGDFIDQLAEFMLTSGVDDRDDRVRRVLTKIAAAYYRMGRLRELQRLTSTFNYPQSEWKLYQAFGERKIPEALVARAQGLRGSFYRFFPVTERSDGGVALVPEKDLCGEAFNGLFYLALAEEYPGLKVACDTRLYGVLEATFPQIQFVPKTPRYRQVAEPARFSQVGPGLGNYLDDHAFDVLRRARFITIDYPRYLRKESVKAGRRQGWLKVPAATRAYWQQALGGSRLIGVSAYSTVRSRLRDIHMIGIEHWADVFSLNDCIFVNLNAAMNDVACARLARQFGIRLVNPPIDLYNDFTNLLSIMSVLDYAIVPANHMMDFAAAVGVRTIVFSPSNIMRSWAPDGSRYIFSDRVRFVFREGEDTVEDMVSRAAQMIRLDLGG